MLNTIIFNVEHGQSIFVHAENHPDYGMLIDCGNTPEFNPIDSLIRWELLPRKGNQYWLSNLTLTNYDHDHYSGLPYLVQKAIIHTVRFSDNMTSQEIISQKSEKTEALEKVCHIKNTYTTPMVTYTPPYEVQTFSLRKTDFPGIEVGTNNLSQIVFVSYGGSVICVSGDVEAVGWEKLLERAEVKEWLGRTNIFVAAHHGRESGYAEEIFQHCKPECIVISDKKMIHGTQEGMCQTYGLCVNGEGVLLNGNIGSPRKILTTRSDGHIWIRLGENGFREYHTI